MRIKTPSLKPAVLPSKAVRSAGANQPNPKTERPAPKPGAHTTAEHWAARINTHLLRSASSLIDAGHELNAAKARLEHGEWQKLVETGLLYLHLREAQRLMKIAEHPVLSKTNNCSLLPASPQALCALAKADPAALQTALDAQQITPRTTIKEANSFRSLHPASGPVPQTTPAANDFDMNRSVKRCSDVLWAEFKKWPEDRRDFLLDQLQVVVQGMANANSGTTPTVNGPTKDAPHVHQGQTV